jgi:uncharacterized SAM-binding protein YcdF (DUF218 family)
MVPQTDIDDLNTLITFLAKRDLDKLDVDALFSQCGVCQVDQIILMGGITTPDFAEMAAQAYQSGFAKGLMVVGGSGHSTQNLRDNLAAHPRYGNIPTADRPEADMLCDVLVEFCGVDRKKIVIERESTNCGNNATFALQVARMNHFIPRVAVIVQDPIMQRRTYESFLQSWQAEQTAFKCFAPVLPLLSNQDGDMAFADLSHGQYYRMRSFLDLVMGEIPRLRDDANGYGPKGAGFIGHVAIPATVLRAFDRLLPRYSHHVRSKHQPEK